MCDKGRYHFESDGSEQGGLVVLTEVKGVKIRLCDFYAIDSEKEENGRLVVRGELHARDWDEDPEIWEATFEKQPGPKGSWMSGELVRV